MKVISKARRFFAMAIAAAVITTGFLASATPGHAAYYCHWSPQGTICHWNP